MCETGFAAQGQDVTGTGQFHRKPVAALTGQVKLKQNLQASPISLRRLTVYTLDRSNSFDHVEDNLKMSPGKSAIMSAVGVALMGYLIFSASESPSPALATLQYILLAAGLVGLIGSLAKIGRRPEA